MAQNDEKSPKRKPKVKPKVKPKKKPATSKTSTEDVKPPVRRALKNDVIVEVEDVTLKQPRKTELSEVKPADLSTSPAVPLFATTASPVASPRAEGSADVDTSLTQTGPLVKPRPEVYLVFAGEYQVLNFLEPDTVSTSRRNKAAKLQWTPARRKAVAEYLAKLQGILRLRDWEIVIDFTPIPVSEEAYATITPETDQRRATIRFSDIFFHQPSQALRQTLVHEMLHCHFFWMESMVDRMLNGISEEAARAATPAITAQVEFIVDAVADAFAPLCPEFELPSR